jgi:oligoribonuclease (3'-5' exoribonuclease)
MEAELKATQGKHDSLLLEAAQMSDAKIAELSEKLEQAVSLKNEAIAELEQERAQASGAAELEERLAVRESEATAEAAELQQVS